MNRIAFALLTAVALGFTSSAFAADLIIDEPAVVPGVVSASGSWDGPFVGVFAGYAAGQLTDDGVGPVEDIDGWLLGVAAGVNFTLTDGIVAGVVGDIAWTDLDNDAAFNTDWVGSLRGRIGFDGGAFLPYLTAGLAFGSGHFEGAPTEDNVHIGWTAGAGVEFAVAENVSLDLQYRYTDYAPEEYAPGFEAGATTHAVTLGLNWGF